MFQDLLLQHLDSIPDNITKNFKQENYDSKQFQECSTQITDLHQPDSHPQYLLSDETQQGDIFDEIEQEKEIQLQQNQEEQTKILTQNTSPQSIILSQNSLNVNCSQNKNNNSEQQSQQLLSSDGPYSPQQIKQQQQQQQLPSLQSLQDYPNQQQMPIFYQDPEQYTSDQLQQQAQLLQWQQQLEQQIFDQQLKFQQQYQQSVFQLFPDSFPLYDQYSQGLFQSEEYQFIQQHNQKSSQKYNNQEILTSTQNPNEQDELNQLEEEYSPNNSKKKRNQGRKKRNQPNINKSKKTLDQAIFMIVLLSYYKYKGQFPGQNFPYTDEEIRYILTHQQQFLSDQKIEKLIQNLNEFQKSNLKQLKNRDKRSQKIRFSEKTILDSLDKNIRIFNYLYNNFQEDQVFIDKNHTEINEYYLFLSKSQNYNNKIKLNKYCEPINIALIEVLQWQITHDQSKQTLNEKIIQCLQYLEQQNQEQ